MKTQAQNKLKFNKQDIMELNDGNMLKIWGGTNDGDQYGQQDVTYNGTFGNNTSGNQATNMTPRPTSRICSVVGG